MAQLFHASPYAGNRRPFRQPAAGRGVYNPDRRFVKLLRYLQSGLQFRKTLPWLRKVLFL
jgi:hypothetical protein